MTPTEPRDRERMHHLMMAALDGEIEPDERRELDEELARDAALRKEWESMSRVKDVASGMSLAEPPAEIWDDYWEDVVRRNERRFGWIVLTAGAVLLGGWMVFELLRAILFDPGMPLVAKVGLALLSLGGAIVTVSVVREKLFVARRDPYREVRR
jgi:anti-sigma factor RsiW